MSAMLDYMQLCRLCLVKDKADVPIFGDENDVRQIFLKITACLPVKVSQEDNLPKKICDSCLYKVDLLYQFWNTTVNAEKQLVQWLTEIGVDVNIKNADTQPLPILPQSHAHPHSMPETLLLKQEHPELIDQQQQQQQQTYPLQGQQTSMYPNYDTLGYPQPEVAMDVPGSTTFVPAATTKVEPETLQPVAPTPKKRGRPAGTTNKKTVQKKKASPPPPVTVSPRTGTNRRSSATAAAAAVAAAAAAASDSDEDSDNDHLGGDDDDDESFNEDDPMTKEEADSESDYVEPTAFVGVPSTSAQDEEQPGPSGLGGTNSKGGTTESGQIHYGGNKINIKDPIEMEPIVTLVELPEWKSKTIKIETDDLDQDYKIDDDDDDDSDPEYSLLKRSKKVKSKTREKPITRSSGKKTKVKESIKKIRIPKSKIEGYKNPFIYDHLKTPEEEKNHNIKEQKSKSKSKWTCLICNKDLPSKTDLIEHYAAHKEDKIELPNGETLPENEVYQCEVCLKEFTSEKRFEKHSETHNDSRFNCEFCEKSFKRPYEYAVHMRFHSNDDKLKCHMCDYSTSYNSALKTHIKRHESEYKYRCEECGKGFFVYTWFEEHKNFHTGAKPFTCDICGKQFAYTRYLTAHKRSMHPETFGSGVPTVNECQFCQKRFAHKKSLLLHVRGHTGENTVLCDICGKRLSSNDHLKLHRRIHTGYKPYKCSVCGKGFSKKCNLTLHERVHSGEKPYVCDACGKCFSQRSTLVIHTRYHTGARPYVCHLCNKGFVAKGVLGIHLKSCNRQNIIGNYLMQPVIKR